MFVTVRQLEDLHRQSGANGHVTLPYRARLTPLASDWVRAKKVVLGYSDGEAEKPAIPPGEFSGRAQHAGFAAAVAPTPAPGTAPTGTLLWWCDGHCGPAKAALVAYEKEARLQPLNVPAEGRRIGTVVKTLASEVKTGRAAAGVLMVKTGAAALVFANRCPSLRAVLGTCLEAVEQGVQQVAANVLVIEYPHQSLQQMKSMIARFARAGRVLSEDARRQLEELASCG
jgi:ribose 5-phosphate isomerase RpiB